MKSRNLIVLCYHWGKNCNSEPAKEGELWEYWCALAEDPKKLQTRSKLKGH